jgi:hypothetical protein
VTIKTSLTQGGKPRNFCFPLIFNKKHIAGFIEPAIVCFGRHWKLRTSNWELVSVLGEIKH